jgi:hypothetical protein
MSTLAYHYVTLDAAAAQAENLVSALGDTGIPVMLDFEAASGDLANFWAVTDAITAAGAHVALSYIPHWYWQQIGSPDLTGVPAQVAGQTVDADAYIGTAEELQQMLTTGDDMTPEQAQQLQAWPDRSGLATAR